MKRDNALEKLVKQVKQKRVLKRAIALLSVVVILVTFNFTKFRADTLQHFTDCGFNYDHQHEPECYDTEGNLTCSLHVHTDACYQTRPTTDSSNEDAAESDPAMEETESVLVAEAVEEAPVEDEPIVEAESEQIEEAVEEVELQLGEEEAFEFEPETVELGNRDFEMAPEELPLYYVGEQYPFFLSDVLAGCGMDIPLEDVVEIGQVLNADDAPQTLGWERIESDYAIYPTQDCEDQELAIITTTGLMTVRLIEAVVPDWAKEPVQIPEEVQPEEEAPIEAKDKVEAIEEPADPGEEKAEPVEKTEEPEEATEEVEAELVKETEESAEPAEANEEAKAEPVAETEEPTEPQEAAGEIKAESTNEIEEIVEPTEAEEVMEDEKAEPVEETEEPTEPEEAAEEVKVETVEETVESEGENEEKKAVEEASEPEAGKDEEAENRIENEEVEEDEETEEAAAEPTAADADIAENRTLIIDLAQTERYPLSLNAILEHFHPAQEAVNHTASEEEAPVEETSEAEVVEVESEAVEAFVDEVEFELGEEPVVTAEVVEVVGKALPVLAYDDTLLNVEDAGNDYLITPVESFDRTDIVVDDTYTILLLNSRVEVVMPMPAQSFEGSTETLTVKVEADEGAFPEGTTMSLADIDDEDTLTGINSAAVGEDFVEVQRVHAVDITFRDAEGNEIEPLIPISVVMSIRETEQNEDTMVVHVDSEGIAEVVQDVANTIEETVEAQPTENLSFVSDAFSVYAVVVTKKLETKTLSPATGETYKITVTYTEDAAIPEGATLDVREIEDDEAQGYLDQAKGAVDQQIALARFFDIKIMDGDTEVQPAAPVMVTVELVNDEEIAPEAVPCAIHFADEEPAVVKTIEIEKAVSFRAEGFSVWGVVYTVDFHYELNGKTFDYSLQGGGAIPFSQLAQILGIAGTAPAEGITEDTEGETEAAAVIDVAEFIGNIESITFSDDTLVSVSKAEEDTTVGRSRMASVWCASIRLS